MNWENFDCIHCIARGGVNGFVTSSLAIRVVNTLPSQLLHLSAYDHIPVQFRCSRSKPIVLQKGQRDYGEVQTVGVEARSTLQLSCWVFLISFCAKANTEWAMPKRSPAEPSLRQKGTTSTARALCGSTSLWAFADPFPVAPRVINFARRVQAATFACDGEDSRLQLRSHIPPFACRMAAGQVPRVDPGSSC